MAESPLSANPYEILGVARTASDDEVKRAFRKALRETHPDTGGDSARFDAVQRAWELIGAPEKRAAFDVGQSGAGRSRVDFTPRSPRAGDPSRPKARTYGHPGGWRRERYLAQLREWVGRGVDIADPYDPTLVRSAPREIRRTLADALAEESTARTLADLGLGFTVWHDVATGPHPETKMDHVVLGPTGLFALLSEDFGGPVRVRRGELIGEALDGERPAHELSARAKSLARAWRVSFSVLLVVLPNDALDDDQVSLGTSRGAVLGAIRRDHLATVLRAGIAGTAAIGGNELFDMRTRIAGGVRFV